jgi:hypothetical protein
MERPGAPWQVYRSYADLQLAGGKKREAVEAILNADEKFGKPMGIAPYAIEVFHSLKDPEMVAVYMERCKATGSRSHIKICQNAAGVTEDSGSSGGFSLPFGGSNKND